MSEEGTAKCLRQVEPICCHLVIKRCLTLSFQNYLKMILTPFWKAFSY